MTRRKIKENIYTYVCSRCNFQLPIKTEETKEETTEEAKADAEK